jgi:hypothetical protein
VTDTEYVSPLQYFGKGKRVHCMYFDFVPTTGVETSFATQPANLGARAMNEMNPTIGTVFSGVGFNNDGSTTVMYTTINAGVLRYFAGSSISNFEGFVHFEIE